MKRRVHKPAMLAGAAIIGLACVAIYAQTGSSASCRALDHGGPRPVEFPESTYREQH